uniref:Uncharacterized protein n=1 Tax=Timspurckia oligopyrenoides TaxID=708627 RepID=A0A7S0ZFI9_9RHOD
MAPAMSYPSLLGGGSLDSAVVSMKGSDGLTCGDVISIFKQVTVDNTGSAAFDIELSGSSSATRGAAFSDCLRAVVVNEDGNVALSSKRSGDLFAQGSSLTCSISGNSFANKGGNIVIRTDVRLACEADTAPAGSLKMKSGNEVAEILEVEKINGAGSAHLTMEKTVTTGDGLCGVHDSKVLTESYVAGDSREVKFCYTLINRGTKPACGVELVQRAGIAETSDFKVPLHALSDGCTAGVFDSLAASSTHGLAASHWSSLLAEQTVRYPCGVTKAEPEAVLSHNLAMKTTARVSISVTDGCGAVSSADGVLMEHQAVHQATVCPCYLYVAEYYVLTFLSGPNSAGISSCTLTPSNDGYRCVDLNLFSLLSAPGDFEYCTVEFVDRYVPIGHTLFNSAGSYSGQTFGCILRSVPLVQPIGVSRII